MMEIIFAGGSHYGVEGFKSLLKYFDKIYILDINTEDILPLMRKNDVLIQDFMETDCKYIFLCGYGRLITEEELEKKVFINIHGALLPKYRGKHSTFYAIMNGEKELGITFHIVDKYMDSGPVLAQYKFEYNGQIVNEINSKIDSLVGEHAGEVCKGYILGHVMPVPQDDSKATFGAKRSLDDCYIDFKMSNKYMKRFFKALTPFYPQPMLNVRGIRYEVTGNYEIVDCDYYGPIGRAVNKSNKGVWIKTADGFLIVETLRDYETKENYQAVELIPIGYRFKNSELPLLPVQGQTMEWRL